VRHGVTSGKLTEHPNPAWLDSPPEEFPRPPVDTRAQTLPYHELSWENFERLILRIVRREANIAECWVYGERGQKQHGLDILAELSSSPGFFLCYQCKRVDKFSPTDIAKAVDTFLQGKWAGKTKRFVLCTSLQLSETRQIDEICEQSNLLKTKGIEFEIWDGSEAGLLSERLKKNPELVDDFFLREWVRRFNGEDAAKSLEERLDGENLAELRAQLQIIYSTLFIRSDQGIRIGSSQAIPLINRYVPPAVIETREIAVSGGMSIESRADLKEPSYSEKEPKQTQSRSTRTTSIQELRMPVGDWFSRNSRYSTIQLKIPFGLRGEAGSLNSHPSPSLSA
jgi:hypothetical protein